MGLNPEEGSGEGLQLACLFPWPAQLGGFVVFVCLFVHIL